MNPSHPNGRYPRIVHPTGEFGLESYIDLGYASPAKYPKSKRKNTKKQGKGAKKKKLYFFAESKGTIQGGSMTAVGLDKFKKDPVVLTEIPPVPDEKGEIVEVQVLKEGKIPEKVQVAVFVPDEF